MKITYEFTLPVGYIDGSGGLHQDGTMRLANALDEIEALNDPRVQNNDAYLPVILLSRVVTRLGGIEQVTPQIIERLFATDMAYLEDLYQRINRYESVLLDAKCPQCSALFRIQVAPL